MRFFKIHKRVAHVTCKKGLLTDKDLQYPENMWPKDQADELVRRGFLYEVEGEEQKISNPEDLNKAKTSEATSEDGDGREKAGELIPDGKWHESTLGTGSGENKQTQSKKGKRGR